MPVRPLAASNVADRHDALAGALRTAVLQRSLDEARAAAFAALPGAQNRREFDATYASWETLTTLESRFQPREWSRIRHLYLKDVPAVAAPAPPPPARQPSVRSPAPPPRPTPSAAEQARVRKRAQIAHVMRDVDLIARELAAEVELQKRFKPSEILANQMTLVAGGVAKILLGAVQLGTAGLSAPITGALIGGVDLATSGARSGLGLDADDAGSAQAVSGTKSLMIASATRAIGPVAPFSLGPGYQAASAVPVLGGAAAMALGAKDVWDGLQGIRLSAADTAFIRQSIVEIRDIQAKITGKAAEMSAIGELAKAAAAWRECAKALGVIAADLAKLLAKQPKSSTPKVENLDAWAAPATRGRSGASAAPPGAAADEPLVMLA